MQNCAMKHSDVQSLWCQAELAAGVQPRETSHGDMTTWAYVPQLSPMPLPPTAQPGSAEGDSRLAGKEMLLHLERRCLLQMLLWQRAPTMLMRSLRVVCPPVLGERDFFGSMKC